MKLEHQDGIGISYREVFATENTFTNRAKAVSRTIVNLAAIHFSSVLLYKGYSYFQAASIGSSSIVHLVLNWTNTFTLVGIALLSMLVALNLHATFILDLAANENEVDSCLKKKSMHKLVPSRFWKQITDEKRKTLVHLMSFSQLYHIREHVSERYMSLDQKTLIIALTASRIKLGVAISLALRTGDYSHFLDSEILTNEQFFEGIDSTNDHDCLTTTIKKCILQRFTEISKNGGYKEYYKYYAHISSLDDIHFLPVMRSILRVLVISHLEKTNYKQPLMMFQSSSDLTEFYEKLDINDQEYLKNYLKLFTNDSVRKVLTKEMTWDQYFEGDCSLDELNQLIKAEIPSEFSLSQLFKIMGLHNRNNYESSYLIKLFKNKVFDVFSKSTEIDINYLKKIYFLYRDNLSAIESLSNKYRIEGQVALSSFSIRSNDLIAFIQFLKSEVIENRFSRGDYYSFLACVRTGLNNHEERRTEQVMQLINSEIARLLNSITRIRLNLAAPAA